MHESRLIFLAAASEARALLVASEVEERWAELSALEGMTVGALAAHLARAVLTAQTYLGSSVHSDIEPLSAAAYVASLDSADAGSELNVGIRERAAEGAKQGARALIDSFDRALDHLRHTLPDEPEDRLVEVYGGLVLPLDEYLSTRIVELTLHSDDLCVSIGRQTPALSGIHLAIEVLVDAAELRHGEVAVLHALARRERDEVGALRVL